jgi:hypothetical protein
MAYKYPAERLKTSFFGLASGLLSLLLPSLAVAQNEVSVDQFTGTANVSIPLTAVGIKDAGVSVDMVYNARGVKVNDQSNSRAISRSDGSFTLKSLASDGSFVGTNWGLSGLPSIQREVRDLPDDVELSTSAERRYGWLSSQGQAYRNNIATTPTPSWSSSFPGSNSAEANAYNLIHQFEQPFSSTNIVMHDSEPDIFSYSFAGHSGRFLFDAQGVAHTMPYDPIDISYTKYSTGIVSIVIRTPEGVTYTFDEKDLLAKKTNSTQGQNLQYKIRDYNAFNVLPNTTNALTYATAWHARTIRNTIGEEITLAYTVVDNNAYNEAFSPQSSWYIAAGNTTGNANSQQYGWTYAPTQHRVTSITSPTTRVTFEMGTQEYLYLASVTTYSALFGTLLKKTTFEYGLNLARQENDGCMDAPWSWAGDYGGVIDPNIHPKRFLLSCETRGDCSAPLTYRFGYAGLNATATTRILPPSGSNPQDYWGNFLYSNRGWTPMIPVVFLFPSLSAATTPNAPFRLQNGGLSPKFVLWDGAIRQAANVAVPGVGTDNCLMGFDESTVLGTLNRITVPTGGIINLMYEAHQYYDFKALNDGCTGPGPRIKAVTYYDNLTGVEQRREYRYTASDGSTSGRLLRAPRFAFLVPAASTTSTNSTQALTDATRRSPNDLGTEPFEGRDVGYQRVTEVLPGRGETTTEFDIPATADDVTVDPAAPVPAGIAWQWNRTRIGIARASNVSLFGPYVPGYDGYPFPLNPPLNFRTGRPLRVQVKAEAVGTSPPALVKQTDYTYRLSSAASASATSLTTIMGLAYEIMPGFRVSGNAPYIDGTVYAYARYELPVDFIYALSSETVKLYDQASAAGQPGSTFVTTATQYGYNTQGRLTSTTTSNTDGRQYRTRYKYAADYGLPVPGAARTAALAPLLNRVQVDRITGEVIETIQEVQLNGQGWTVLGGTLNTFTTGPSTTTGAVTRPYQVWHWQANPSIAATAYDETRVQSSGSPATWDLHIGNRYRLESTIEEVDSHLQPLTVSSRAGRNIAGQHFSHLGTLPVLNIANAYASEVVFSDFESSNAFDQAHAFQLVGQPTRVTDPLQARSGTAYLSLPASNTGLTTPLPAPGAGALASPATSRYVLSYWARAATATSLTVELTPTTSPPTVITRAVGGAANAWELIEVPIDLTGITPQNRASYTLTLKPTGNVSIAVDDVLLLPSTATAQSSTYDVNMVKKSSETDARHATTYYDYNRLGQLAYVRDHNKHIVRQVKQTLSGAAIDNTALNFTYSAPACSSCSISNMIGGTGMTFTALGLCGANSPRLEWNFGDASTPVVTAATTLSHTFPQASGPVSYTVTLTVTTVDGSSTLSKVLTIYPAPLLAAECTDGITQADRCGLGDDMRNDCQLSSDGSQSIGTWSTTFIIRFTNSVMPAGVTYQWFAENINGPITAPYTLPPNGPVGGSNTLPPITAIVKWPATAAATNQCPSGSIYLCRPTIGYRYACVINAPNTRPIVKYFQLVYRSRTSACP